MIGKINYYSKLPYPLDKEQTYDLFVKMKKGDYEAKEKLVLHNLRLVINVIIREFYNTQFEFEELVSIGNIGLIKAINTFDISKDRQFSTYATRCIMNEILMFLRKNGKNVSLVSLDDISFIYEKGEEIHYEDIIPDNVDIIEEYERKDIAVIINKCFNNLSDIERECIIMNFGLFGRKRIYQSEIAKKLNRSQPYISRLICNALKKIRIELCLMGIIEGMEDESINNSSGLPKVI